MTTEGHGHGRPRTPMIWKVLVTFACIAASAALLASALVLDHGDQQDRDIQASRQESRARQADFNADLCKAVALIIRQRKQQLDPRVTAGVLRPLRQANPAQYDRLIKQSQRSVDELNLVRNHLRC